mgnify:FL=1
MYQIEYRTWINKELLAGFRARPKRYTTIRRAFQALHELRKYEVGQNYGWTENDGTFRKVGFTFRIIHARQNTLTK